MDAILNFLQAAGEALTPEVINALAAVLIAFLMIIVGWVAAAFVGTETGRKALAVWRMVDTHILDAAWFIGTTYFDKGGFSVEEGEALAAEYLERYGKEIDHRLAYVVKRAELLIESYAPFDFDFFVVVARAERIYQENRQKIEQG